MANNSEDKFWVPDQTLYDNSYGLGHPTIFHMCLAQVKKTQLPRYRHAALNAVLNAASIFHRFKNAFWIPHQVRYDDEYGLGY